ncbi:MAG: TonB family protein [Myxococcales bacterium]|nr:TonB family protein [Myxococcales bacterium]
MVGDLVGRERASSGSLPPQWRDIERTLSQQFHPAADVVRQEQRVKALAHQILRSWLDGPPTVGRVERGVDASVQNMIGVPEGQNIRSMPGEQAAAIQSRWGAAATSLRVEVEVTLDADGHILRSRIVHPSGRRAFDRTALAAVVEAIRAGGPPEEKRTVVTRWKVDAAVAVAPPTAIGFRFDESGHLNPGATGIRKYIGLGPYPFEERVQTHVSLTSIQPQR